MKKALITHIQRFSSDDGPGIRTTVFFKGCSLSCIWCHNPECIQSGIQLQFFRQRCSLCGNCVAACPHHAQYIKDGERSIDRSLCKLCFQCVDTCGAQALQRSGRLVSIEDLLSEVLKDLDFYRCSDGGVTLSGGEPLLQWEFCREFLKQLSTQDIHTVVETAGNVPYRNIEAVLSYVGLFLYDIKFDDSSKHEKYTSCPNRLIKENLERLLCKGANVIIRIPVIPGINDGPELVRIAEYLRGKSVRAVELLPYHDYGISKYYSLGRKYSLESLNAMEGQALSSAVNLFSEYGLAASIH